MPPPDTMPQFGWCSDGQAGIFRSTLDIRKARHDNIAEWPQEGIDGGRKSHYCYNVGHMPATEVRAFRDADRDNSVPIQDWLADLERREPKAYAKCLARILDLAEKGNEMRRPHADYLRDGVYELRATLGKDQYRVLYFFCGKNIVTLSHGTTKKREVPPEDIELAIVRMGLVRRSPTRYTADFDN